jgi:hypothetical protein
MASKRSRSDQPPGGNVNLGELASFLEERISEVRDKQIWERAYSLLHKQDEVRVEIEGRHLHVFWETSSPRGDVLCVSLNEQLVFRAENALFDDRTDPLMRIRIFQPGSDLHRMKSYIRVDAYVPGDWETLLDECTIAEAMAQKQIPELEPARPLNSYQTRLALAFGATREQLYVPR